MAETSSEKQPPHGAATPRQSKEEGRQLAQSTPTSKDGTFIGEDSERKMDEKAVMKVADESSEDHVDLQKLDSKAPKSIHERNGDPYGAMSSEEAAILKRQVETPDIKVGMTTLYRYATRIDLILLFIGAVCAIASGAILPLMTVVFGSLQGTFAGYFNNTTSYAEFTASMTHLVLYFVYLGIGMFFTTYVSTVVFIYTGEHIAGKIREHYLESCLRQNIGFFDNLGSGEVVTRITADTNLIQEGISEKVGLTLTALATFFAAFIIGFVEYWKLTLILVSTVVAITLVMGGGSQFIVKFSKQNINAYALGGTVAEETLSSVRNAVAFGTQDKLAKLYDTHLVKAEYFGIRLKGSIAIMIAGLMSLMVCIWAFVPFPLLRCGGQRPNPPTFASDLV